MLVTFEEEPEFMKTEEYRGNLLEIYNNFFEEGAPYLIKELIPLRAEVLDQIRVTQANF